MQQLSLSLEPGLAQRYRDLREQALAQTPPLMANLQRLVAAAGSLK